MKNFIGNFHYTNMGSKFGAINLCKNKQSLVVPWMNEREKFQQFNCFMLMIIISPRLSIIQKFIKFFDDTIPTMISSKISQYFEYHVVMVDESTYWKKFPKDCWRAGTLKTKKSKETKKKKKILMIILNR